ncbi:MAG: hypothetical protein ACM3X3_04330 [Betaproteobacteria bacterium]
MEVQDTKDSRREIQTLQEAVAQQSLILQRLERSLKRLEESYDNVSSRLEAIEAARPGNSAAGTVSTADKGRAGAAGSAVKSTVGNREYLRDRASRAHGNPAAANIPDAANARAADPPPSEPNEPAPSDGGQSDAPPRPGTPASRPDLLSRAKIAIRSAIADGTVNNTLDKVQSSLKLADEAAGALAEISALVKSSLTESASLQGSGPPPIPGGSITLLLELAKTPQFQRFAASMLTQFLKDADLGARESAG